jgi:hypothetical protein
MAFSTDDILGHAALERSVRQLAQSLLQIHDASPRLASVFGTWQRWLTDVTSVTGLAQRLKLSRTQFGRKLAAAEAMGSLGWAGARGRSRLWVSQGFRREYQKAQANKLAVIDAACEACFTPRP